MFRDLSSVKRNSLHLKFNIKMKCFFSISKCFFSFGVFINNFELQFLVSSCWGQEVFWHPWRQGSGLREMFYNDCIDTCGYLDHWPYWNYHSIVFLCFGVMIWNSAPRESQRLLLQSASRNEHLSPVLVKPFLCLNFVAAFPRYFKLLSLL